MRQIFCTIGALALLTTTALAGDAGEPAAEPMIAPVFQAAPAATWDGFYGGLSYGVARGQTEFFQNGLQQNGPWDVEGNLAGAFAGYAIQRGQWVYGGELSFAAGEVRGTPDGFEEQQYQDPIDLKARVGYVFGSALVYGVAGYSVAEFAEDGEPFEQKSGFSYGVGVDYKVSDRIFVGAEYLSRDLSGALGYAPGWSIENSGFDTVSIRVGMTF